MNEIFSSSDFFLFELWNQSEQPKYNIIILIRN